MTYQIPPAIEKEFVKNYLFTVHGADKKEIESKWCDSPYWYGKKHNSTLFHTLKVLRLDGIIRRRKHFGRYVYYLVRTGAVFNTVTKPNK